jgi:hypothetical protein
MMRKGSTTRLLCGLALLSALLAVWVNPGNLGSIDPRRRLQVTLSWVSAEPEVAPNDPYFGIVAADGMRRAFFGAGQSVVFLPFERAISAVLDMAGVTPGELAKAREPLLAMAVSILLAPLAACLAFLLLRDYGFSARASGMGALSLLLATTTLHYVQNCQENLQLLVLAMAALLAAARWAQRPRFRTAVACGAAMGFSILTRLTSLLDTAAVLMFALLLLTMRSGPRGILKIIPGFALGFGAFAATERLYQYHRFGNWLGNYYGIRSVGRGEAVFSTDRWSGLWQSLILPDNSIVLFDPLLPLALLALWLFRRRLTSPVRAHAAASLALLAGYLYLYSAFSSPTGETSWGDRYVHVQVTLVAMLAVPCILDHGSKAMIRTGLAIAGVSVAVQLASLLAAMPLEAAQGSLWVIPRRFANVWLIVSGGADSHPSFAGLPVEWRRLNLLPFQMMIRYPDQARVALGVWIVCGAAAAYVLVRLVSSIWRAGTSPEAAPR